MALTWQERLRKDPDNEWARRQERAQMNLRSIQFANAVRVGKAASPKEINDLVERINAPVRIQKGVAPSLAGLAVRVTLLAARKAKYFAAKALLKAKGGLDTKSLIAGAVVGEALSQAMDDDLPDLVTGAGSNAKALMRASGERFGIGGSSEQQAMLRFLQPTTVAVYLGAKLLTVVSAEVAAIMLEGMKRNMRNRIRVR